MTEQLDIVKLIEENPIVKLTNVYQSKLINKIKNKFNTEGQRLFVASFYCFLHYKKEDFVIGLNSLWIWLGFSSKHKAKELLLKYFTIEIDYKILLTQKGENLNSKDLGGRPIEQILMTIKTFKRFCMKANTKKAVQIHEYFINLEETLHEVLDEETNELRLQLDNTQYQLEQKQIELDNEKKNKNWLLNRRYQHEPAKQCIYLYKDGDQLKIGKSEKGIADREKYYSDMSKTGEIVYFQNCLNCNLTEKVLHHILDKYRIIRNREWFNFTEELAIQTIKSVIYIMDSHMDKVEAFIPKLHNLLEIPIHIENEKKKENIVEENKQIKNPMNFDLFIEECCEIVEGMNTAKTYIKDAHRIWSKNSTKETISALDMYLNIKFKSTTIIDENGVSRNMFKDVKLKPFIYTISENNLDYEQFITNQISISEMKVDWKARITYLDFFNYFVEWKQKSEPYYKLKHSYKKEIQVYLEQKFAAGRVYESGGTKTKHLTGLWGLGAKKTNFGLKNPDRTNKKVGQYTIENVLIKQWDSLSIASRELNMGISTLSNYARFKTIKNGIYYKYED